MKVYKLLQVTSRHSLIIGCFLKTITYNNIHYIIRRMARDVKKIFLCGTI